MKLTDVGAEDYDIVFYPGGAAIALLTGPPEILKRIKACPACGWFFRDDTRSATRKWCSMATCGSAAKSRSYYWRTKRESS